jgi:hypothetical protein
MTKYNRLEPDSIKVGMYYRDNIGGVIRYVVERTPRTVTYTRPGKHLTLTVKARTFSDWAVHEMDKAALDKYEHRHRYYASSSRRTMPQDDDHD